MRFAGQIVLWGAVGCANFESVDDACRDSVRGDQHGTEAAADFYGRISCYRRYVGLDRANINERVTEAVEAHASYLGMNATLSTNGQWSTEDASQPGFTGQSSFDRLVSSQFLAEDDLGLEGQSTFVWEILLPVSPDLSSAELVDAFLVDPFFRDALLAPAWEGAGYAEFSDPALGAYAYANVVLYYPSGARSTRPVVYPQDGQTDVPTSWNSFDPASTGLPATSGMPISFTVGSSRLGNTEGNLLSLAVRNSSIVGPSGPVEHLILLPGYYATGPNWSTAILAPLEPLEPNADYTVEVELSWIDVQSRKEELTFTTGDE